MDTKAIILFGSGGHAGVVISAIETDRQFNIIGLFDDFAAVGEIRHGYRILGNWKSGIPPQSLAFIAVGDVKARRNAAPGNRWATIIHPLSKRESNEIGCGSFIGANAFIGRNSKVGNFSIVNTGAILEHNCSLGNYCHLCPGVVMGGSVAIGDGTTIGLNACIKDHVTIGKNCTIGMGSVVLSDVPDNRTAFGNPCKLQD